MGGYDGANFLDIVEAYDTRADKWRRVQISLHTCSPFQV